MDWGAKTGLFAAALGVPIVLLFTLLGSTLAAVFALALVVSLTVSFAVAGRLADTSHVESESAGSGAPAERNATDPLEALQNQYARGELTESEFEQRLETVLETEPSGPNDNAAIRSDEDTSREPEFERP
ncbi:SHOCT domain-containing protein [Halostagnicola bangensis]